VAHYIHQLTDESNGYIFLPVPVLAASPAREPPKQAKYMGNRYMHHNITHIHKIHNIVYDKFKTSSQQEKQPLWRRVFIAGSSRRVEEAVDKVVSLPVAL
jgi:hypothetical protein